MRALLVALLVYSAAPAWAEPTHCIQGEWRGTRSYATGFAPAEQAGAREEGLRLRTITLALDGKRITLSGLGTDGSRPYRAEQAGPGRARVEIRNPHPGMPRQLLFEITGADGVRVDLEPGKLIEMTRLADPPDGNGSAGCIGVPLGDSPGAGLIAGDWVYVGWESSAGVPVPAPEGSEWREGTRLSIDARELRASRAALEARAPYTTGAPAGNRTSIRTEATFFGGKWGESTVVNFERRDEDRLRLGLEHYKGIFLALRLESEPEIEEPAAPAEADEVATQDSADSGTADTQGEVDLEVPFEAECEGGAVLAGSPPPDGLEQWCEIAGPDRERLRHGWSIKWYPNGSKREAGRYESGREHGVWLRWDEKGRKRVQAEFKHGVQDGVLIRWNGLGTKTHYLIYRDGVLSR